jgi:hypothetical protein
MYMRTVIDLDDEALAAAARELGTSTKKDTVNAALSFVANRSHRVAAVLDAAHSFGVGRDIGDVDVMSAARR